MSSTLEASGRVDGLSFPFDPSQLRRNEYDSETGACEMPNRFSRALSLLTSATPKEIPSFKNCDYLVAYHVEAAKMDNPL